MVQEHANLFDDYRPIVTKPSRYARHHQRAIISINDRLLSGGLSTRHMDTGLQRKASTVQSLCSFANWGFLLLFKVDSRGF
ncbi:hypothetical protein TNCV_4131371 [Trichonephila clavipes]|nr:hypothetical protein TNCV_4131371 [Trichonephila clavipes]